MINQMNTKVRSLYQQEEENTVDRQDSRSEPMLQFDSSNYVTTSSTINGTASITPDFTTSLRRRDFQRSSLRDRVNQKSLFVSVVKEAARQARVSEDDDDGDQHQARQGDVLFQRCNGQHQFPWLDDDDLWSLDTFSSTDSDSPRRLTRNYSLDDVSDISMDDLPYHSSSIYSSADCDGTTMESQEKDTTTCSDMTPCEDARRSDISGETDPSNNRRTACLRYYKRFNSSSDILDRKRNDDRFSCETPFHNDDEDYVLWRSLTKAGRSNRRHNPLLTRCGSSPDLLTTGYYDSPIQAPRRSMSSSKNGSILQQGATISTPSISVDTPIRIPMRTPSGDVNATASSAKLSASIKRAHTRRNQLKQLSEENTRLSCASDIGAIINALPFDDDDDDDDDDVDRERSGQSKIFLKRSSCPDFGVGFDIPFRPPRRIPSSTGKVTPEDYDDDDENYQDGLLSLDQHPLNSSQHSVGRSLSSLPIRPPERKHSPQLKELLKQQQSLQQASSTSQLSSAQSQTPKVCLHQLPFVKRDDSHSKDESQAKRYKNDIDEKDKQQRRCSDTGYDYRCLSEKIDVSDHSRSSLFRRYNSLTGYRVVGWGSPTSVH